MCCGTMPQHSQSCIDQVHSDLYEPTYDEYCDIIDDVPPGCPDLGNYYGCERDGDCVVLGEALYPRSGGYYTASWEGDEYWSDWPFWYVTLCSEPECLLCVGGCCKCGCQ